MVLGDVLGRAIVDLLFPPTCQVCRGSGDFPLCVHCRAAFRLIVPPVCNKCGKPLDGPPDRRFMCGPCRHAGPYFDCARAAGIFDGPLREAIHALKFNGRRALAGPLGGLVAETVATDPRFRADVVVPVPLHPRRHRERGFSQAELLAAEIEQRLHIPLVPDALVRVVNTRAQVGLGSAERGPNVRGAFALARRIAADTVLLVDDVMSTGATASECAKELRRSGVRSVVVATVALAVLDRRETGRGRPDPAGPLDDRRNPF